MEFKNEMQLDMICLFPNPPDYLLWQANRHCRYKRNNMGHTQGCGCVCMWVCAGGQGYLARPTTNTLGGGFQTEAKCAIPLWFLLPLLMQLPTLRTVRSVIAVKCREHPSWKEPGGRERWAVGAFLQCSCSWERLWPFLRREGRAQGVLGGWWGHLLHSSEHPVLLSWMAGKGDDPKSLAGKRELAFPVLTASRCASASWMLGPMPYREHQTWGKMLHVRKLNVQNTSLELWFFICV